jgi:hypothetical protein
MSVVRGSEICAPLPAAEALPPWHQLRCYVLSPCSSSCAVWQCSPRLWSAIKRTGFETSIPPTWRPGRRVIRFGSLALALLNAVPHSLTLPTFERRLQFIRTSFCSATYPPVQDTPPRYQGVTPPSTKRLPRSVRCFATGNCSTAGERRCLCVLRYKAAWLHHSSGPPQAARGMNSVETRGI